LPGTTSLRFNVWTLTLTASTCSDGGDVCDQTADREPSPNRPNNAAFVCVRQCAGVALLSGLMSYWKNDEVTGARVDAHWEQSFD
jgi:hypothetical protein